MNENDEEGMVNMSTIEHVSHQIESQP